MQIVDAQVHAWRTGESTGHHRRASITIEVLRREMAEAGVARVLLVPPLWDPSGNAYSLEAARNHPDQFAVMGVVPQRGLDAVRGAAMLREWKRQPGLVGIRFLFNEPARIAPLRSGSLDWVWPVAQEIGLTVALLVPNALDVPADLAERYPDLKLIVDHLGVPRGASGPNAFDHLPQLLALSRFANVSIKAVGVCDYALDDFPFPSLDEPLKRVFDAFGAERVIWGSDLSRLKHSYRQCVTHFTEALPWLSDPERAMVMGQNLNRLTGWSAPQMKTA